MTVVTTLCYTLKTSSVNYTEKNILRSGISTEDYDRSPGIQCMPEHFTFWVVRGLEGSCDPITQKRSPRSKNREKKLILEVLTKEYLSALV